MNPLTKLLRRLVGYCERHNRWGTCPACAVENPTERYRQAHREAQQRLNRLRKGQR